jgi:glycosyltransferase involved in cell wall biosynthesis
MINLAFICTSKAWGGLELNVVKLTRNLSQNGVDVTIFARNGTPLAVSSMENDLKLLNLPFHRKYFCFKTALKLFKILSSGSYDGIFAFHTHDLALLAYTKKLLKLCRKPLPKMIYQQQMQLGVDKRDWYHTFIFSQFDYWISPLKLLAEQVTQKTRFPAERILQIPLGVEVEKFKNSSITLKEAREFFKVNENAFLFGIIGRIDKLKGQLFLCQAIIELRKKYPLVELLIVGEPTLNEENDYFLSIKELIKINNAEAYIHIRPFLKEVIIFYKAIDCFVMASQSETYGMVTIEAMAAGVPVIGTNSGGTPEILGNGEFGLLYNYNDLTSFLEKAELLINHQFDVSKTKAEALKKAIERYSTDVENRLINNIFR